jgi:superkiller protein 3
MKNVSSTIRFINVLTLLLLLTVPLVAQSKRDRERAKNLQDQGDRAFSAGNYQEAIDKYAQSISVVATNSYAHYRKGFAHFNLKQNTEALNEFAIALSQGFRPIEVHRVRGYIYYEQKDYDNALREIQSGLALAPRDLVFLKALGEVQLARNALPEALDALQRAAKVAPYDPEIDYYFARVYFASGDVKEQERAAASAISKGTRFVGEAHYFLGDARQKLRNNIGAIDAYQKAINAKPDLYQAYRNLAEAYRGEGRYNDAIAISKQALQKFPSDGNVYTDLSWYYSLSDRPEDAIQAAKAGITLLPQQYMAYTNLCRAYNDTKQFDLAITTCNTALRLQPGDGETYFYLARAYNLSGKTVEATRLYGLAVKGLEDYVSKLPDYSDGWYLLGNAYFADNQRDKAINAYTKCLELSPKFVKAMYNLGVVQVRKKNRAAATEQYNRLVPLDARLATALKAEIDKM